MTHGREKSDPSIVATKLSNKVEQPEAESVERREGAEGNTGRATHAPDSEPGDRVTGARPCTESNAAKEEGTVQGSGELWNSGPT
jgi:hypothetical protein